jgi:hypothetical protein
MVARWKILAYQSARRGGGMYDLFQKPIGGSGPESVLLELAENKTLNDWSRDKSLRAVTPCSFASRPHAISGRSRSVGTGSRLPSRRRRPMKAYGRISPDRPLDRLSVE